jgi:hypothetical protein
MKGKKEPMNCWFLTRKLTQTSPTTFNESTTNLVDPFIPHPQSEQHQPQSSNEPNPST